MSGVTEALPAQGSHAEQMDAVYALQRHIYDFTRKYYLLGRDTLIDELDAQVGDHVLEVGCGTARNLVAAAWLYPGAHFYGIDISAEMLKSARAKLARKHLDTRIRLACADATAFDPFKLFQRRAFDRIVFSYTLSMIPGWDAALELACTMLVPGGEIHLVDFGQQERLPEWCAPALRAWLARFHVTPRAGLLTVCDELAARHGLSCFTRSLCRDYAWNAVLARA